MYIYVDPNLNPGLWLARISIYLYLYIWYIYIKIYILGTKKMQDLINWFTFTGAVDFCE